jgi:phenylacetate-CoA ligase
MLNYRLGDLVTLGAGPCPCGRTLPTLEQIDGRTENSFLMPDGSSRRVVPILIELQRCPDVVQVQIRHEQLRRFVVRAVLKPGADREAFRLLARRLMGETAGSDAAVDAEFVETIDPGESGKVRAIVRCFEPPPAS